MSAIMSETRIKRRSNPIVLSSTVLFPIPSTTMKLLRTITLLSYLVSESVQFPQQQVPTVPVVNSLTPFQDVNFVRRRVQFFPVKRQVNAQEPQQQQVPGGGAGNEFRGDQFQENGGQNVGQFEQNREYPRGFVCDGRPCTTTPFPPIPRPCESQVDGSGTFVFTCFGPRPTLRPKNILWLQTPDIKQAVKVIVPNYDIHELIQAGFKEPAKGHTNITVVVEPPTYNVTAQRDAPVIKPAPPVLNVTYLPAKLNDTHFQNDKHYVPLTSPIEPPPRDAPIIIVDSQRA